MKRPNITPADAEAIERERAVDRDRGRHLRRRRRRRPAGAGLLRQPAHEAAASSSARPSSGRALIQLAVESGRFFTAGEVQRRRNVIVLGQTAVQALFPALDPIGKTVRLGLSSTRSSASMAKRPSPGGFDIGADDYVDHSADDVSESSSGIRAVTLSGAARSAARRSSAVPRDGVPREQAMREVEEVMRIRHGLRLDEPNDFDIVTQDAILEFWDQISQATFLALVVLSSIALMVGGIGVMSIMTISVTERTREIGVRKALGARRVEILWQFLLEAVFLTSAGGVLGIIVGAQHRPARQLR